MDDIAPYRGASAPIAPASRGGVPGRDRPAGPAPAASTPYGPDLAAVKTPGHYLGALRRRFWLALIVAVPLGALTSIYALRLPRIYEAKADIRIQQPQYDAALAALMGRDFAGRDSNQAGYAADMVTDLQGRRLADRVVASMRLPELAQLDDPAMELIVSNLTVRPLNKSSSYRVSLTGRDPALTQKLLEAELEELVKFAKDEQLRHVNETVENARWHLNKLETESTEMNRQMLAQIESLGTIGPGGRNILEEQYAHLGHSIEVQQARAAEFQQRMLFGPLFSGGAQPVDPAAAAQMRKLDMLLEQKDQYERHLNEVKRQARNFDSDPAARRLSRQLSPLLDEIDKIDRSLATTKKAADPTEAIHESIQRDLEAAEVKRHELLVQLKQAMPEHQKFLSLMEDRDATRKQIAELKERIAAFEIAAKSQKPAVEVLSRVQDPGPPIKPNRAVTIVMGLIVSMGLGLGLVFLLEHLDHSVRVPEHVSHGLALPLLGVVPRIPRTSLTHRGGHLWTSAVPDSAAADAYRNIRASLLGVADRNGPIVSLLVTSAKAGDGKSTAALNLAAACARAGERTLLMDVDLRRPTLADVFPAEDEDGDEGLGLVDVLKGTVPWQATLRRTDLHNLDFIPTGDPRGVPIEILGTLELRQLLAALTHHYDRVILDGPAILGMADCRVLGRMVDAAMMVVRSGAHQTMTLQRAKAVLEQSHVEIAGVIVNNLSEGVQNWSSYGYGPAPALAAPRRERALPASSASPSHEEALAGAPAEA